MPHASKAFAVELGERPWGMVDFRVLDPDGNRIGFGSVLAQLDPP